MDTANRCLDSVATQRRQSVEVGLMACSNCVIMERHCYRISCVDAVAVVVQVAAAPETGQCQRRLFVGDSYKRGRWHDFDQGRPFDRLV